MFFFGKNYAKNQIPMTDVAILTSITNKPFVPQPILHRVKSMVRDLGNPTTEYENVFDVKSILRVVYGKTATCSCQKITYFIVDNYLSTR